ncbi:MAG: fluoride efflux transporter CrcB [Dehalococcoidia bacterium]
MTYALIIAGAAMGAPLRYFLQGRVQDAIGPGFPYGTLVVNLTGCMVMGLLATLAEERGLLGRDARIFLLVGFLGSYTTFSTFGWETLELLRDNEVLRASINVAASAVGGIVAAWLGTLLARVVYA